MDKEVLRELMGHSEFDTTDFYYIHISEERKQKEYDRIHNNYEVHGKRYILYRKKVNKKTLKLA